MPCVAAPAGIDWNYLLNGDQAMLLVILAAAWKQISYNFLFFLAGLQAIPQSLLEAAAIDGAGPRRRFWTIVFPLLAPTSFFLLVVNIVYAFFDTFGVIHNVTQGGPAKATEILVYKVWYDGIVGLDLGGSAAQSVILMAIVIALTAIQFRFIERRVHYCRERPWSTTARRSAVVPPVLLHAACWSSRSRSMSLSIASSHDRCDHPAAPIPLWRRRPLCRRTTRRRVRSRATAAAQRRAGRP